MKKWIVSGIRLRVLGMPVTTTLLLATRRTPAGAAAAAASDPRLDLVTGAATLWGCQSGNTNKC
jgi:hypothetical protein